MEQLRQEIVWFSLPFFPRRVLYIWQHKLHVQFQQEHIFEAKIIIVEYKVEKSKLRFFNHDLSQSRKNLCAFSIISHKVLLYPCPMCIVLIIVNENADQDIA